MTNRTTIIEVARAAGVSKSTVSRVLLGGAQVKQTTQQQVLDAIAQLGYERNELASSLRTDRTRMVMVAVPDITNPFWSEVARGLQDGLERDGYSTVLANSDWDGNREQRFLSTARRNRFDAIAINPAVVTERDLLAHGSPMVILGLRANFSAFDMVGSDSYTGAIQALEYLYELGHRYIGFIRGKHPNGHDHARHQAYHEFLHRHGLPFDPSLIVEMPFDLNGGHVAAQQLLDRSIRPTAIFAANDILAIGAMQYARHLGLDIPRDLSVVGMDDIYPAATAFPPLTTVAKDKYAIGTKAARFLLDRINSTEPLAARRYVVPCQMLVRGSTAPPTGVTSL